MSKPLATAGTARLADYEQRVAQELAIYAEQEVVHDLPPIFHYWSERHLRPRLAAVGIDTLHGFYAETAVAACAANDRLVRVASIGSGNGELEVGLARAVADAGHHNVRIACLEFNGAMLERTLELARGRGVEELIEPVQADFNIWRPDGPLDVAVASHSLHHVVDLEHLFDGLREALAAVDGVLLVNDMVGRNGHRRWPEALELLDRVWETTPERYRYNHQHARLEERYPDWDCAVDGFEGIRAQDILPLLLQTFHAERFVAFANVIDPFIDRGFGPNLDVERADDRAFVDAVAALDDAAIDLGILSPTHLVASFRTRPVEARYLAPRSPQASVRRPRPDDGVTLARPPRAAEAPPMAADLPAEGATASDVEGRFDDGWAGRRVSARLHTLTPATELEVTGETYGGLGDGLEVEVLVGGRPVARGTGLTGPFMLRGPVALGPGATVGLELRASATRRPLDVGESDDVRELAYRLDRVRLHAPRGPAARARGLVRALRDRRR